MSNILFPDVEDRAAFLTLPPCQQERAELLTPLMYRLEISGTAGVALSSKICSALRINPLIAAKFSCRTIRKLFTAWRKAGRDWRTLIDRRRIPFA